MILVQGEWYCVCKIHAKMSNTLQGKFGKYSIVNMNCRNFGAPLSTQLNVGKLMKIFLKRGGEFAILTTSRNEVINTVLEDFQSTLFFWVEWFAI